MSRTTPARSPSQGRPATWDDLESIPEGAIGEIVAGEILVTPRPNLPHTRTASRLGMVIGGPFDMGVGGPGGWVILSEPRIAFHKDIRVPDLAGWRLDRWTRAPRRGPIPIIPDWVCEVLSRTTEREDRTTKLELYARSKVRHLWLIDPAVRTLEIYRLAEPTWLLVATHADAERVRVEPFEAIDLDLSLLWSEVDPDDPSVEDD